MKPVTMLLLAACTSAALAQKPPTHPKLDWSLYSGVVASRGMDYWTTERVINRGGRELLLPSGLVRNKPAFLGFEFGSAALEIFAARLVSRHHPTIARSMLTSDASAGFSVAGHNLAVTPKKVVK